MIVLSDKTLGETQHELVIYYLQTITLLENREHEKGVWLLCWPAKEQLPYGRASVMFHFLSFSLLQVESYTSDEHKFIHSLLFSLIILTNILNGKQRGKEI